MDQTLTKLSLMHSEKLAIKLAIMDDSCGPNPSITVSGALDHDTKKPKESLGFVSICQALASLGFSIEVGDIGTEQPSVSLGFRELDPTLAQKLAQCTAKMDIQSIFETLGDKERIEAVLFLKKLRERSSQRL